MVRIPSVLGTDDLPLAELCAARIDGDLGVLHEAFIPVDEPDLPALRARALAIDLDASLILDRRSAAWVHGAVTSPPHETQLCRSTTARGTARPGTRGVRELVLTPDEIVDFGDVRCTSRARTAFDLLRDPNESSEEIEHIVSRLLDSHADAERALRTRLAGAPRMPYRALALSRLERAVFGDADGSPTSQPSATR